jgi:quinoprotein glucose dehydrogenase
MAESALLVRRLRWLLLPLAIAIAVVAMSNKRTYGQAVPADNEWPTYGGNLASQRYRALDQITRDNFNDLEVAWRFKTDALGPRPEFNFQSTPLMVGGVLFTTAGTRRAVVALDAATGEMLWMHRTGLTDARPGSST